MRRRNFIAILGGAGAAASMPLALGAQQAERVRRVGALLTSSADDPETQFIVGGFSQGLQVLGWTLGRNVRIDYRWAPVDDDRVRRYAAELVALVPDVMLGMGGTVVRALQQASPTVPIVFANVTDPVGGGLIESLARPGRNSTGFLSFEYGMGTKWLELLKQMAPQVTRVAVVRDPTAVSGGGQFGAIQGAALSFGMEVSPIDAREAGGIERAITALARAPNGSLILTQSRFARRHRQLIIALAARHKLPAIYSDRFFVAAGGLISYGVDYIEQFRQAAGYVDRILKGAKPADLPVQAPTKFELAINLKTAKMLGLTVPPALIARADEVIE
jgi:putative ABC transport system substrate-binding protein